MCCGELPKPMGRSSNQIEHPHCTRLSLASLTPLMHTTRIAARTWIRGASRGKGLTPGKQLPTEQSAQAADAPETATTAKPCPAFRPMKRVLKQAPASTSTPGLPAHGEVASSSAPSVDESAGSPVSVNGSSSFNVNEEGAAWAPARVRHEEDAVLSFYVDSCTMFLGTKQYPEVGKETLSMREGRQGKKNKDREKSRRRGSGVGER